MKDPVGKEKQSVDGITGKKRGKKEENTRSKILFTGFGGKLREAARQCYRSL